MSRIFKGDFQASSRKSGPNYAEAPLIVRGNLKQADSRMLNMIVVLIESFSELQMLERV